MFLYFFLAFFVIKLHLFDVKMNYEKFIQFVRQSEHFDEVQQKELKELTEKYPYFKLMKWLYLRSLNSTNSVYFGQELKKTALYAADRRNLYYYIHPEELQTNEPAVFRNENSGGYFDMLNKLDSKGENNRKSLFSLAEKLKAARETLKTEPKSDAYPEPSTLPTATTEVAPDDEVVKTVIPEDTNYEEMEKRAKRLIKEKKYVEAIEILEELNLNNPKKSIYFADQIRFLKKIIQN